MKRTHEETITAIIKYFEENEETFNACIEELDGYNGYLNDNRYYPMEYLTDFYGGTDPIEVLQRAYFGYDADNWITDSHGEKHYSSFNPNRDYFTYNGYGNLVSTDFPDYSAFLDSYAVESMSEHRNYIAAIESDEELTALFDELESEEEI